ncbi:hypothetical protein ACIBKX_11870 [Streptomyces sp. NPDC050658]|uniref:hypothetical protein n=1 Tax=unclassified Streptomyces TaxID=2593676 RepID=UPI00341EFD83
MGTVGIGVRKRRQWARAVACCLVLGALTSCGSDGKIYEGLVKQTPAEKPRPAAEVRGERLSLEAVELMKKADSVRISVEMTKPAGRQKVSLHMDRRNNCTGTFDSGPQRKGELIMVGGEEIYVRFADEALDAIREAAVARGPEIAARARERTALARGKYMKVPSGSGSSAPGTATAAQTCDLDRMLGQLNGSGMEMSGTRALPGRSWHGDRVTPLAAKDGGHDMTVYLAAGDKPYILGMTQRRGDERMEMRMSDYDKPVVVSAPDPSLVVDIEAFGMGGGSLFEV